MSRMLFISDGSVACQGAQLSPFRYPCRIARCGVQAGLASVLATRQDGEDILVLNVLSSFAASCLVGCSSKEEKESSLVGMINQIAKVFTDFLSAFPSGKIFILMPLARFDLPAFNDEQLPFMHHYLLNVLSTHMFGTRIMPIGASTILAHDYVHDRKSLKLAASQRVLTHLISIVNANLPSENLEIPNINQNQNQNPPSPDPHRLAALRADVDANTKAIANTKEAVCNGTNLRRSSEILVLGLRLTPLPSDIEEKKTEVLKSIGILAGKVFGDLVPPFEVFIRHGKSRGSLLPPVEVRFTDLKRSAKDAEQFRRGASLRVRGTRDAAKDPAFEGLYFCSILTLPTRVRIEVMKAIAREMTGPEQRAYAPDFGPRPLILVHPNGEPTYSLSYMESLEKFGHLVDASKLVHAYRRAGTTFKGEMRQTFWILKESCIIRHGQKRDADGNPIVR